MRTLFSVFALLGIFALPQAKCQVTSIGPKDFAVMAWGSTPSSPEQLRGMKEAGLNISGFCQTEDLDKVRAAGLTCFVRDEWINAHTPPNLPSDSEIREHFAHLKSEIGDNPAALGVFLRDEPSAALMPGLGKLAASLREAMPEKWPYVNLFPYRVSPDRLGTRDYDSYVRMLVKTIGQPFLSYDNYSLVGGEMLDSFYTNLDIVRRLAWKRKRRSGTVFSPTRTSTIWSRRTQRSTSRCTARWPTAAAVFNILPTLLRLSAITVWRPSTSSAIAQRPGICCAESITRFMRSRPP